MTKTCKHCKFHVKYDDTTGFCYRLPPQMVDENKSAVPPVTSDKTWCGELKPKGWFK